MNKNQLLYAQIVEAFEAGITNRKVLAERFNINERTVYRFLNKWRANTPVEDIREPGRPPIVNSSNRTTLARLVAGDPLATSKELAAEIEFQTGEACTSKTIRNTLHSMGYKSSIPRVVPLLTDTMKEKRVVWARENQNRDWNCVLFTDETIIQLQANVTRAWHKNRDRPNIARPKYPKKAMFWGGVSRNFKTELHLIDGTVTAASYITLLREKILPWIRRQRKGNLIFQQDNAPAHTARATTQFFAEEKVDVLDWPSNSPDLNPIENIWGILKRNVDKRRPQTLNDLISIAKEEWKKISLSTVKACIDSMPKRLNDAIQRKGEKTDY